MIEHKLAAAVLKVGDGRGFVVKHAWGRYVITAAHCLPHMPPAAAAAGVEEKTYGKLLGPLGSEPTVWAECKFVDPVADIAVLGEPDYQELPKAVDRLVGGAALRIGCIAPHAENIDGRMLSLEGEWLPCKVAYLGGPLWTSKCSKPGMSGSPIIDDSGKAIGVIASGSDSWNETSPPTYGPHPCLAANLPGWLLRTRHKRESLDHR
jgi:hypothetical protein